MEFKGPLHNFQFSLMRIFVNPLHYPQKKLPRKLSVAVFTYELIYSFVNRIDCIWLFSR